MDVGAVWMGVVRFDGCCEVWMDVGGGLDGC